MQGYGSAAHPIRTVLLTVVAVALMVPTLGGCGLLADESKPKAIDIPGTAELSTEAPPSGRESVSATRSPDSSDLPPSDSYEYAIRNAPRVSNSGFHTGSTTATGTREDDLAGFHFSTPDRQVRCSLGSGDNDDTLACVGEKVRGPAGPPPGSPDGCQWDTGYVLLNHENVSSGACANLYPVLYRSMIVPFGSAMHIDRFSCLSDFSGLYCIETSSGKGFSITKSGYREISADDRAPESMRPNEESTTSTKPKRRSTEVPTP